MVVIDGWSNNTVSPDKQGEYRLINIFHFLYFQWKFWSLPSHIRKLRYLWLFHCWACHRWWWQMIKFYKHKHNNTLAVILTLFVLFSFLRNKFSNEPLQTFSVHNAFWYRCQLRGLNWNILCLESCLYWNGSFTSNI